LILLWHPKEVLGGTNKQYHSKELEQSSSVLFFPFSTTLAIEKIGFEKFPHIPTGYYIRWLLATTGPYFCSLGPYFCSLGPFFSSLCPISAPQVPVSAPQALFLLPGPLFLLPGPAAGIQILGIPTAKIQISNGRHTCYRYPPELKPSA
jgi:hypothetical protein